MSTNRTTRTGRQLAVMRAAREATPPYVDTIRRCSGLPVSEFDDAVRDLIDAGILRRYSAPHGELLYPTMRSLPETTATPDARIDRIEASFDLLARVATELNRQAEEAEAAVERRRVLLHAWLYSGSMVGADLDKLRADTEAELQ